MTPELRRVEWTVLVLAVLCLLTAAVGAGQILDLRDRVSRLEQRHAVERAAVVPEQNLLQPRAPAGALGPLRCDHGESSIVARVVDGKLRVSRPKTTGCVP